VSTTIAVETDIDAPAELVAFVLFEFSSYPAWNPFVREISGHAAAGERLKVRIEPPGAEPISLSPTVLEAGDSGLHWIGRMLVPGIFDGEHTLEVVATGPNRSVFRQRERFSGVLVPFTGGLLAKTRLGFEAMNRALKERAEAFA
jgi:hypothetical protein